MSLERNDCNSKWDEWGSVFSDSLHCWSSPNDSVFNSGSGVTDWLGDLLDGEQVLEVISWSSVQHLKVQSHLIAVVSIQVLVAVPLVIEITNVIGKASVGGAWAALEQVLEAVPLPVEVTNVVSQASVGGAWATLEQVLHI